MKTLSGTISLAAALLAAGCAFNAEEAVTRRTWRRDISGITKLSLGEYGFGAGHVVVDGTPADSLMLSCDLRRMVVGDNHYNDVDLRVTRVDSGVTLSLLVDGDQWTTVTVDNSWLRLAHDTELDLGAVDKSVTVRGYRGLLRAQTGQDRMSVVTARGGILSSGRGDIVVGLAGDSLDPVLDTSFISLQIESQSGDVTVLVPAGMRVNLDLSAGRNGTITVDDSSSATRELRSSLNGGSARSITCSTGGSVTVTQVGLQ